MEHKFERLSDEIYIEVSAEHTFGTDALLLAYFASPKNNDRAMDMGTGCGIIPFLWLRNSKQSPVHCLDIQQNAIEQVKRSIERNALQGRLVPHLCDLREIRSEFPAEGFSLVTMNPPYKPVGTGIESKSNSAKIARHERLADAVCLMRQYSLEPKRLRFVTDKKDQEPFLFLIEGKKNAKPFLRVEPLLQIKKENGKFTREMLAVYGSYADGYDK